MPVQPSPLHQNGAAMPLEAAASAAWRTRPALPAASLGLKGAASALFSPSLPVPAATSRAGAATVPLGPARLHRNGARSALRPATREVERIVQGDEGRRCDARRSVADERHPMSVLAPCIESTLIQAFDVHRSGIGKPVGRKRGPPATFSSSNTMTPDRHRAKAWIRT